MSYEVSPQIKKFFETYNKDILEKDINVLNNLMQLIENYKKSVINFMTVNQLMDGNYSSIRNQLFYKNFNLNELKQKQVPKNINSISINYTQTVQLYQREAKANQIVRDGLYLLSKIRILILGEKEGKINYRIGFSIDSKNIGKYYEFTDEEQIFKIYKDVETLSDELKITLDSIKEIEGKQLKEDTFMKKFYTFLKEKRLNKIVNRPKISRIFEQSDLIKKYFDNLGINYDKISSREILKDHLNKLFNMQEFKDSAPFYIEGDTRDINGVNWQQKYFSSNKSQVNSIKFNTILRGLNQIEVVIMSGKNMSKPTFTSSADVNKWVDSLNLDYQINQYSIENLKKFFQA